ncbi:hypothetical protein KPATCC21470_0161 [Kitasatospora purpeofusca]
MIDHPWPDVSPLTVHELVGAGSGSQNLQIYVCPTSFDHPHLEVMQ